MSYAGGSFHMALDNSPSTFDPILANDFYSATILNQVFEGLVTYDSENLSIVPQIAKSWEISEDGKTYKFLLRNDVFFHGHSSFDSIAYSSKIKYKEPIAILKDPLKRLVD
jgi:ABC-type transport system substrate-binding protein